MSIVVDLPAPFGPSSATVSPAAIEMSMPRTARTGPWGPRKDLTNSVSRTPEDSAPFAGSSPEPGLVSLTEATASSV